MNLPRATATPAIPSVPSRMNDSLLAVVRALKEVVETREGSRGTDLDAAVTFRDLVSSGVLLYNGSDYSGTGAGKVFQPKVPDPEAPDMTVPPAPTGFAATSGLATAILQWTDPKSLYGNHSHTEIWRSASNNLATALMVGTSAGFMFNDPLGQTGAARYYWIRFVSTAGVQGPPNAGASGGTLVNTGMVGGVDLLPLIVDASKLASEAVTPSKIAAAAVGNAAIQNAAITNAKIGDLAVDSAKLASAAVTEAKIQDAAISSAKIRDAAITTAKIGTAQVTTLLIGNNQVTVPVVATAYQNANYSGWYSPSSSYGNPVTASISLAYPSPVIVTFSSAALFYGYGSIGCLQTLMGYIYTSSTGTIWGSDWYLGGVNVSPGNPTFFLTPTISLIANLPAGSTTVYVGLKAGYAQGSGGSVLVGNMTLSLTAVQR